jgi:DNA-binding MarR family transcriptional regulator
MNRPVTSDLMECADCLCLASRRAARTMTRAFDRKLRPFGIRATQFSALVMLSLRGALTIGELANSLGVERTTLTRNLELIEAKGWVKVLVGEEDARARVVSMTPKGRAAVNAAVGAWREAQNAALAAVGNSGANAIRKLSSHAIP